ncbi:hypothetical protein [Sphingomonas sp.]|uniref:hypothetical protein n=1 Tax=Sphingomonadales TaxID=204457 RepID=UPI0035C8570A
MTADAGEIVRLAELCEAGQVPSRDLDALIAPLQGLQVVDEGHPLGRVCYDQNRQSIMLPRYTASIDAAMTLVPEGMWAEGALGSHADQWSSLEIHAPCTYDPIGQATAATPALALTAAALRARAQHDHEVG